MYRPILNLILKEFPAPTTAKVTKFLNSNNNNNSKSFIHTTNCVFHSEKLINVKDSNGVREIILNNPKTRNALSMAMMNDILSEMKCKLNDEHTRCIVISSTGPVYSAGHNLKELVPETGTDFHRKIFSKLAEIIITIHKAPIPIIAKVDGLAAAAGCQFVASCDMIICSERSSFSTPAYLEFLLLGPFHSIV